MTVPPGRAGAGGVTSELSRRMMEAQERERTRLARELHDDIGQRIALLGMDVARLRAMLPALPDDAQALTKSLSEQIMAVARDVSRISHRLHSSKLDYLGLAAAAGNFCEELASQYRVEVEYDHEGVSSELPDDIALAIFRVLQEALSNAMKHSGAGRYRVILRGTHEAVTLEVVDDGCGFDVEAARSGHGLGLVSIEERLSLVLGEAIVESAPRQGTRVCARVPLASPAPNPIRHCSTGV